MPNNRGVVYYDQGHDQGHDQGYDQGHDHDQGRARPGDLDHDLDHDEAFSRSLLFSGFCKLSMTNSQSQ